MKLYLFNPIYHPRRMPPFSSVLVDPARALLLNIGTFPRKTIQRFSRTGRNSKGSRKAQAKSTGRNKQQVQHLPIEPAPPRTDSYRTRPHWKNISDKNHEYSIPARCDRSIRRPGCTAKPFRALIPQTIRIAGEQQASPLLRAVRRQRSVCANPKRP